MSDKKEQHIYKSECCGADFSEMGETIIVKDGGITSYYNQRCLECKNPCHTRAQEIYDSAGIKIEIGDLIECPSEPEDSAIRWHIAFESHSYPGWIEIRDLGHNNLYMYDSSGGYYTRGHYSKYPGRLDADDLEYYFNIPKE